VDLPRFSVKSLRALDGECGWTSRMAAGPVCSAKVRQQERAAGSKLSTAQENRHGYTVSSSFGHW